MNKIIFQKSMTTANKNQMFLYHSVLYKWHLNVSRGQGLGFGTPSVSKMLVVNKMNL